MDPFDEFEFKPLTNGLGFHKKAAALKDQLKKSGVIDSEIQGIPTSMPKTNFDEVISNLEKSPLKLKKNPVHDLEITETLPRDGKKGSRIAMDIETPRPVQSPFPKPEAFRQPFVPATPVPNANEVKKVLKQKEMQNIGTRRGAADSPKSQLEVASTSIPSAVLDLIVVVALSLVFVVALTMVTGVDLTMVIMNTSRDLMTQISAGMLFVSVMQMYVIISRSFYGRTLGEWTFDHQLGAEKDQLQNTYPLRVALRSFIITVTGLVILPLISLLIGRDIAGKITGTQLYRQRV